MMMSENVPTWTSGKSVDFHSQDGMCASEKCKKLCSVTPVLENLTNCDSEVVDAIDSQVSKNEQDSVQVHSEKASVPFCYECPRCEKTFNDYDPWKHHLNTHGEEKPFECPRCGKKFSFHKSLRSHVRHHTYKCAHCRKKYCIKKNLRIHMKIHNKEKRHKCGKCGDKVSLFRPHTEEKLVECAVCKETFCTYRRWQNHIVTHGQEKEFKCKNCFKSFKYLSLVNHSNDPPTCDCWDSQEPELILYECKECGLTFNEVTSFQKHINIHKQKRFQCPHCSRLFSRRDAMEFHMLIHKDTGAAASSKAATQMAVKPAETSPKVQTYEYVSSHGIRKIITKQKIPKNWHLLAK